MYMRLWNSKNKEGEGQRRKKRMQEKKGFDSIIFLVPFDLPFKKIPNEKKKTSSTKNFLFRFRVLFSNRQKESKNHIDTFYNHTSEFFESYKSKQNEAMIRSS